MSDIILTAIAGLITTFGGAFAGWFFTRKKNKADVKITELDAVERAITVWRNSADMLTIEIQKLREENSALYKEITKLKSINNKILCALKNITPDNAKEVVQQLNADINNHE